MRVEYCEPWNGRLALSGVVFSRLKALYLANPCAVVTERQLYDWVVGHVPGHADLLEYAGIPTIRSGSLQTDKNQPDR